MTLVNIYLNGRHQGLYKVYSSSPNGVIAPSRTRLAFVENFDSYIDEIEVITFDREDAIKITFSKEIEVRDSK